MISGMPNSAENNFASESSRLSFFLSSHVFVDVQTMSESSRQRIHFTVYAGPEFVDALKYAPPRKEYLDARKPIVKLVEELSRKRLGHVYIRKGDFALSVGRRAQATSKS